jgi:hypothetical protein
LNGYDHSFLSLPVARGTGASGSSGILSRHVQPGKALQSRETFMASRHHQSPEVTDVKTGFGWIEIGGTLYEHDVVIHPDGRVSKRKKKASKIFKDKFGHTPLSEEELGFLADERPDIIYVGTGQYGDLPVTPEAEALIASYHGVMMPTPEILPVIEGDKRRFVAILHVTC